VLPCFSGPATQTKNLQFKKNGGKFFPNLLESMEGVSSGAKSYNTEGLIAEIRAN
jgi:hypothetical protein